MELALAIKSAVELGWRIWFELSNSGATLEISKSNSVRPTTAAGYMQLVLR